MVLEGDEVCGLRRRRETRKKTPTENVLTRDRFVNGFTSQKTAEERKREERAVSSLSRGIYSVDRSLSKEDRTKLRYYS